MLYPDYLSLAAIPDSVKNFIKIRYSGKFSEEKRSELFAKLDMPWQPELTAKAREFVLALDRSRNLDYQSYVPHLARIINADTN